MDTPHPAHIAPKIVQFHDQGQPYFSCEFFPPQIESGMREVYRKMESLSGLGPIFIDVTWKAGQSGLEQVENRRALEMCSNAQKYLDVDVMLHLCCFDLTETQIVDILHEVKKAGVRNILALRGDPPEVTMCSPKLQSKKKRNNNKTTMKDSESFTLTSNQKNHNDATTEKKPTAKTTAVKPEEEGGEAATTTVVTSSDDLSSDQQLAEVSSPSREPTTKTAKEEKKLKHAVDLVKVIRKHFGTYFCIGVGGYPESKNDFQFLQQKIEAGADFVISQLFYDPNAFISFVQKCRKEGITVPILPGVMPIISYSWLTRVTKHCHVTLPSSILDRLREHKEDTRKVREIGVDIIADMCIKLMNYQWDKETALAGATDNTAATTPSAAASVPPIAINGIHFYTFNLETSVRSILDRLKENDPRGLFSKIRKSKTLPWSNGTYDHSSVPVTTARESVMLTKKNSEKKQSSSGISHSSSSDQISSSSRDTEEAVRPIYWANRPDSYIRRTECWEEFPNGRWGDRRSAAFGELSSTHYYNINCGSVEERLEQWGTAPLYPQEIFEVFAGYLEGKVSSLPWSENEIQPETANISSELLHLNRCGFLTINSQPRVNGMPSDDPQYGWGGKGGVLYQKSYIEMFVSPEMLAKLIEKIKLYGEEKGDQIEDGYPSNPLMYQAADVHGNTYSNYIEYGTHTNFDTTNFGSTAVTWGVWPDREVIQPTIVDPETFLVWKEEAFDLWNVWISIYPESSPSRELLQEIHDTYFLVNIVDNDYVDGDIFRIFKDFQPVPRSPSPTIAMPLSPSSLSPKTTPNKKSTVQ